MSMACLHCNTAIANDAIGHYSSLIEFRDSVTVGKIGTNG